MREQRVMFNIPNYLFYKIYMVAYKIDYSEHWSGFYHLQYNKLILIKTKEIQQYISNKYFEINLCSLLYVITLMRKQIICIT